MSASSASGIGNGSAEKLRSDEIESLLNTAPTIIFAGIKNVVTSIQTSPPTPLTTITLPYPLIGGYDNYAVLLTSINGGKVYIVSRSQDSSGSFTGFTVAAEADCSMYYMVCKIGSKPQI